MISAMVGIGSVAWWVSGMFPVGKRGMIRAGGSASRISNNHNSTDPGGGDIVSPTTKNKLARVSPVANSRRPGWSPSVQAYPPFGSQRTIHSPESIEGAGRRPRRPAQPHMEQIDPLDCVGKGLAVPLTPVFVYGGLRGICGLPGRTTSLQADRVAIT